MASRTTRLAIAVSSALVVLGATGVWASIPDSAGVIHGCYLTSGNPNVRGVLRVIDTEVGEQCGSGETAITWNQEGPQGATGPQGPIGATGAQGPAGTSVIRFPVQTVITTSSDQFVTIGTWTQPANSFDSFVLKATGNDKPCGVTVGLLVDGVSWQNAQGGLLLQPGPDEQVRTAREPLFEPGTPTSHTLTARIGGCSDNRTVTLAVVIEQVA